MNENVEWMMNAILSFIRDNMELAVEILGITVVGIVASLFSEIFKPSVVVLIDTYENRLKNRIVNIVAILCAVFVLGNVSSFVMYMLVKELQFKNLDCAVNRWEILARSALLLDVVINCLLLLLIWVKKIFSIKKGSNVFQWIHMWVMIAVAILFGAYAPFLEMGSMTICFLLGNACGTVFFATFFLSMLSIRDKVVDEYKSKIRITNGNKGEALYIYARMDDGRYLCGRKKDINANTDFFFYEANEIKGFSYEKEVGVSGIKMPSIVYKLKSRFLKK